MPLYSIGDLRPQLGPSAWAAPSADLIGDVRLGERASVWFGAVIRADNTPILIGEDSNIQDGAIGHSDPGFPLTIGARVTVGHQAILHGCTVADDCLIGMGARILNGAVLEAECMVGAGALVTEGKTFDRRQLDRRSTGARGSAAHRPGAAGCCGYRRRIMPKRRRATLPSSGGFERLAITLLLLRRGAQPRVDIIAGRAVAHSPGAPASMNFAASLLPAVDAIASRRASNGRRSRNCRRPCARSRSRRGSSDRP